ncbi:SsgA family sporulation/cell division regulator [Streptosporangium lutulentum]
MNAELAGREIVEGLRLQPIEAPDQHQVAVLTYRTDQPYAVRLTFLSADLAALFTCTFERGLLIDGLLIDQPDDDGTTLIGAGEVQVGPGPIEDRVLLRLRLHDGEWFELYADRSGCRPSSIRRWSWCR